MVDIQAVPCVLKRRRLEFSSAHACLQPKLYEAAATGDAGYLQKQYVNLGACLTQQCKITDS